MRKLEPPGHIAGSKTDDMSVVRQWSLVHTQLSIAYKDGVEEWMTMLVILLHTVEAFSC